MDGFEVVLLFKSSTTAFGKSVYIHRTSQCTAVAKHIYSLVFRSILSVLRIAYLQSREFNSANTRISRGMLSSFLSITMR